MSKTLKTYPDGSEITVANAAVATAITAVMCAGIAVAVVKYDSWNRKRITAKLKKQGRL